MVEDTCYNMHLPFAFTVLVLVTDVARCCTLTVQAPICIYPHLLLLFCPAGRCCCNMHLPAPVVAAVYCCTLHHVLLWMSHVTLNVTCYIECHVLHYRFWIGHISIRRGCYNMQLPVCCCCTLTVLAAICVYQLAGILQQCFIEQE